MQQLQITHTEEQSKTVVLVEEEKLVVLSGNIKIQMITRYSLILSGNLEVPMKALDNQIVLEGLFTICLYTHVGEDKEEKATYQFVTNRFRNYPAKSPMDMFSETLIPNDLQIVCDTIDRYYAEETPVKDKK
jgi:hypothetical protein